jgi:hypothetical protein
VDAHVIADTPMTESLPNAGVILHALAKLFVRLVFQRIIDMPSNGTNHQKLDAKRQDKAGPIL